LSLAMFNTLCLSCQNLTRRRALGRRIGRQVFAENQFVEAE